MSTGLDQRIDGVRSDKSRAARYHYSHMNILARAGFGAAPLYLVYLVNRPAADRVILEFQRLHQAGLV